MPDQVEATQGTTPPQPTEAVAAPDARITAIENKLNGLTSTINSLVYNMRQAMPEGQIRDTADKILPRDPAQTEHVQQSPPETVSPDVQTVAPSSTEVVAEPAPALPVESEQSVRAQFNQRLVLEVLDGMLTQQETTAKPGEKLRNAFVPLAGALGAGRAAAELANVIPATLPIPAVGALISGVVSLTASGIRKVLTKEQSWEIYARYSRRVENTKTLKGKVAKLGELVFQAPERFFLERLLRIKETGIERKLVEVANDNVKLQDAREDPIEKEYLLKEACWYILATQNAKSAGATITAKDQERIDRNKTLITNVRDTLLQGLETIPAQRVADDLKARAGSSWRKAVLTTTIGSATRAALLVPAFARIGMWFSNLIDNNAHFASAGASFSAAAEPLRQGGQSTGEGLKLVGEGLVETGKGIANEASRTAADVAHFATLKANQTGDVFKEAANLLSDITGVKADQANAVREAIAIENARIAAEYAGKMNNVLNVDDVNRVTKLMDDVRKIFGPLPKKIYFPFVGAT